MPPKRTKRPAHRPVPSTASKAALNAQLESANGWTEIVDVLRKHHGLEDLNTRHGLKSVHKSYPELSRRLNATYTQYEDNEDVRIGFVMLWWKMCLDSVLRDKLVEEGYLAKVAPLLQNEKAQNLALNILATVTHHGGHAARQEVIRSVYPTLRRTLKVALEDNGHPRTIDQCVTILSHSATAVLDMDTPAHDLEMDVPELLRLCTSALRIQKVPGNLFRHVLLFVESVCVARPKDILPPSPPAALRFLIACLRSDDLQERIEAYYSLYSLYQNRPLIRFDRDPNRAMRVVQNGIPTDVQDVLVDYGMDRSQFIMAMKISADVQKALMKCVQDGDLLSLGWTLFRYILVTEYSVPLGGFADEHGRIIDVGLPFKNFEDSLPHCAKALREAGPTVKKNLDAADCLELKYYMIKQDHGACANVGRQAIERNPKQPYFHYIYAGATSKAKETVQRAKFGLKMCDANTSTYIRCGLLHLSSEKSIILSKECYDAFLKEKPGRVLEEAVAYLTNALEDSAAWLKLAAPDMARLPGTIGENVLLQLALRGKEISPDMKEVRPLLEQFRVARRVSDVLWGESPETQSELVFKLVTGNYAASCSDWGATLQKIQSSTGVATQIDPPTVDDVSAWLETVHVNEGYDLGHHDCGNEPRKKLAPQDLYRCTYCGNPSAALRKCSRCKRAVYCGAQCQKTHWSEGHKNTCVEGEA